MPNARRHLALFPGDPARPEFGADDYDSLIETLEILGDSRVIADIHEAQEAIARGETSSEAEIRELLRKR